MSPATTDPQLETLWKAYLDAERIGRRSTMLEALGLFIAALAEKGPVVSESWALALAEQLADGGDAAPVRFPLLREVLGPALVRGVIGDQPGCARWLACLLRRHPQLERTLGLLPEQLRSSHGLLLEALRLDDDDQLARRALVESTGSHLAYTLHALPAGVLYGHDGATVEQCAELIQWVSDFKEHVGRLGKTSEYAELIDDCEYHYRAYRQYLAGRTSGDSYAAFLSRTGRR